MDNNTDFNTWYAEEEAKERAGIRSIGQIAEFQKNAVVIRSRSKYRKASKN